MRRILEIVLLATLLLAAPGALRAGEAVLLDLGPAAGEAGAERQGGAGETPAEPGGAGQAAKRRDDSGGTADTDGGTEKTRPFQGGRIEGTVGPANLVKQVRVVERSRGLSRVAVYDRETCRFVADGLPAGVWAVEIDTAWGIVQGVDMRFRPAELDKAVPAKPRGADPPKPPPLDDEDRAEITRHITGPERFMTARPMIFRGDGRRATVLVSLLRDTAFHGRKGDEIIWRLETWYYEDAWGHWERLGGTVIFRERVSLAAFGKRKRQFEPSLGGLEITPRTTAPLVVNYTVGLLPRSRRLVPEAQDAAPPPAPGDAESPDRPAAEPESPGDAPKLLEDEP